MHADQLLLAVDQGQPSFCACIVLAVFCHLCKRQVGLRQGTAAIRRVFVGGRWGAFGQLYIALEGDLGRFILLLLQLQGAQQQPTFCQISFVFCQQAELGLGFWIAAQLCQYTGIAHAYFWCGLFF